VERRDVVRPGSTLASSIKEHCHRRAGILLCALVLCATVTGCGSYASQAEKYLSEASSEVAGAAYVLERFEAGEVSGPFVRSSLQQYAKAMQSTSQSLRSLEPPPGAHKEHERAVEALSRAQALAHEAGRGRVEQDEAKELARRLSNLEEELKA
jgi:hypothetical protein